MALNPNTVKALFYKLAPHIDDAVDVVDDIPIKPSKGIGNLGFSNLGDSAGLGFSTIDDVPNMGFPTLGDNIPDMGFSTLGNDVGLGFPNFGDEGLGKWYDKASKKKK
jgi:hypothetical protein